MSPPKRDFDDIELTPKTKVSASLKIIASVFGSVVMATLVLSAEWWDSKLQRQKDNDRIETRFLELQAEVRKASTDCLSQSQFQRWDDMQRDINAAAYANLKWAAIPSREPSQP